MKDRGLRSLQGSQGTVSFLHLRGRGAWKSPWSCVPRGDAGIPSSLLSYSLSPEKAK